MAPPERKGIPASELSAERTYFTFPSGVLTYNCVTCNATCCRGYGYLVDNRPVAQAHLAHGRNLHVFVDPQSGAPSNGFLRMRNCPPGCFFLTEGGLCGIQAEHGYDAKPETCRLFPFNYIRQVGQYVVVAPHPGLCPLQVVSHGSADVKSDHTALLADMRSQGISAPIPLVDVPPGMTAERIVSLELAIREAANRFEAGASYLEFAVQQLLLTCSLEPSVSGDLGCPSATAAAELLEGFQARSLELLGIRSEPEALNDAALVRTAVLATSTLRASIIFRPTVGRTAHSEVGGGVGRLPYVMQGVFLLAALAHDAGMASVTFQTLMRLADVFAPVLNLLANADRAVEWKAGVMIPPMPSDCTDDLLTPYLSVVRDLLPRRQRRTRRPLGDVLADAAPRDAVDRVRFLTLVGQVSQNNLIALGHALDGRTSVTRALRAGLQRTVLGALDVPSLSMLITARRRTSPKARGGSLGG